MGGSSGFSLHEQSSPVRLISVDLIDTCGVVLTITAVEPWITK